MEHMLRERMAVALERMAVAIPTNADHFSLAEEAKRLQAELQERRVDAARKARSPVTSPRFCVVPTSGRSAECNA